MNEDKLISAFSQLLPKLVFIGKEENNYEISQVSCNKNSGFNVCALINGFCVR
jgi:hypothetical protein